MGEAKRRKKLDPTFGKKRLTDKPLRTERQYDLVLLKQKDFIRDYLTEEVIIDYYYFIHYYSLGELPSWVYDIYPEWLTDLDEDNCSDEFVFFDEIYGNPIKKVCQEKKGEEWFTLYQEIADILSKFMLNVEEIETLEDDYGDQSKKYADKLFFLTSYGLVIQKDQIEKARQKYTTMISSALIEADMNEK
ncbi:MAG: hypothetical protein AB4060_18890 [Crocosphaera sp.]